MRALDVDVALGDALDQDVAAVVHLDLAALEEVMVCIRKGFFG